MIDEETISKAANLLLRTAPKGSKVILSGSHARGDADRHSDLDFIVVEPEVENRFEEMVRLAEILRPLRLPVEILVHSAERFEYWRDTPNTVIYRAIKEGKFYEQVA